VSYKATPKVRSMSPASAVKFALTSVLLSAVLAGPANARTAAEPLTGPASVSLSDLPRQARDTHELIRRGGPFPYEKDGTVFFNREKLLPLQKRGYWREYTVKTPGSRDRGARRIVCGGPPVTPHACYYTADHYASFRKIVE
jgi:ribonuclease T1